MVDLNLEFENYKINIAEVEKQIDNIFLPKTKKKLLMILLKYIKMEGKIMKVKELFNIVDSLIEIFYDDGRLTSSVEEITEEDEDRGIETYDEKFYWSLKDDDMNICSLYINKELPINFPKDIKKVKKEFTKIGIEYEDWMQYISYLYDNNGKIPSKDEYKNIKNIIFEKEIKRIINIIWDDTPILLVFVDKD